MKKLLLIFVFTLGLVILLASLILIYLGTKQTGKATQIFNPLPPITIPGLTKTEATLLLAPSTAEINKGSAFMSDIRIKADNLALVAISLKLNMDYNGQLPLKPQINKVIANPELIKAGWNYTVNRIEVDNQNRTLFIELLMVNLKPDGFRLNGEISLGTVKFVASPSPLSVDFQFDSRSTKIKDKNGDTLKADLEGARYIIK